MKNTRAVAVTLQRQLLTLFVATRLVLFFSGAPTVTAASMVSTSETTARTVQFAFSPEQFLVLTNSARAQESVASLVLNDQLVRAAEAKAVDMAAKNYWNHFRPGDNKAPWDFIEEAGYSYRVAGENLARGFRTPEGITHAWLQSPAHRANLMSPKYKEVGFACLPTINAEGQSVLLTVEMFGTR
jgi:uncharacterized protein YkwD